MKTTNINPTDAANYITAMEYLKDLLATCDCSEDFAPDENTLVTAWDLLTNTPVYNELKRIARGD